ncbi:helix-turn-helix domain-containing protein [Achromobacter denitrificans]
MAQSVHPRQDGGPIDTIPGIQDERPGLSPHHRCHRAAGPVRILARRDLRRLRAARTGTQRGPQLPRPDRRTAAARPARIHHHGAVACGPPIADRAGGPRAFSFFANLLCAGEAVVSQGGSTQRARAGDVYVVDCASPWEVDFRTDFRMFCIEIPEGLLRPQLGRSGRLALPVVDGSSGAGRVLASYMRLVSELPANELQQVQALMIKHCGELLSRTQLEDAGAQIAERVRYEVLERILALVQRRLADRALTPASASEELGISRSYLFKVMAEHGLSFSAHVRQCRLEQCRLAIEAQSGRSIADIAASWGFEEVSTFNRAYRAQYGRSPGSERAGTSSRDGRRI